MCQPLIFISNMVGSAPVLTPEQKSPAILVPLELFDPVQQNKCREIRLEPFYLTNFL